MMLGAVDSHMGPDASVAQALNHEVVSVNYRLAPELDYPAMLAECRTVLDALQPSALVGDSAGGRLAIDLAHSLSDAPPLGLIYPPVGELSLACLGKDAPLLSRRDIVSIRAQCPEIIATERDRSPPASGIEILTVEHDPLTRPIEAAAAEWRLAGASTG